MGHVFEEGGEEFDVPEDVDLGGLGVSWERWEGEVNVRRRSRSRRLCRGNC